MENIFLAALLIFVGWNVISIRNDMSARKISTTLFLSIESNEEDEYCIPIETINLLKKTNISFAISPGMELVDPGEHGSLKVLRVIFEDFQSTSRGVYLQSKKIQLSQFEDIKKMYLKHGWENGR